MANINPLQPSEDKPEGNWVKIGGKVVADETTKRIEALISGQLTRFAASSGGWEILLLDPNNGRKWELTYPHSDWHGGGPPTLTGVGDDYAQSKYKFGETVEAHEKP